MTIADRLEDNAAPGHRISDRGDEQRLASLLHAAMLEKLHANRGKLHWLEPGVEDDYLLERLREEIVELADAVERGDPFAAWREAGDVANFAAMLADRTTLLDAHFSGGIWHRRTVELLALLVDATKVQRQPCSHEGPGLPGCVTCDPRVREALGVGAKAAV